jgi:Lon protease-like protein
MTPINTTTLPAFPLKNLVIFPGMSVEFFIFEPRYIQMIEHSLDSKGLFCFCTIIDTEEETPESVPDLFPYGCVCSIQHYEKHVDGRYSIIVRGEDRVTISEAPSEQLYRLMKTSRVPYTDDLSSELEEKPLARAFIKRFVEKYFREIQPGKVDQVINDMGFGQFLPMLCSQCPSLKKKLDLLQETSLKRIFLELKDYLTSES